jgi:ABC-type iron transport system FetAB permease component
VTTPLAKVEQRTAPSVWLLTSCSETVLCFFVLQFRVRCTANRIVPVGTMVETNSLAGLNLDEVRDASVESTRRSRWG